MKLFFLNLFSLITITVFCSDLTPSYKIISSVKEKALTDKEAVFVFTFFNENSQPLKNEIIFSYNGIEKKQKTNANNQLLVKVKPGKYVFNFLLNTNYYEIITDSILIKPGFRNEIQITFKSSIQPVYPKKPVIYVYPTKTQKISVNLKLKGEFLFTYPEYQNGWDFTAEPNGKIYMNNKQYHYLFWDGQLNIEFSKINWKEGFVVAKKDLVNFFEKKLMQMGLSAQEMEDYITYWCPIMSVNEKNYIHFMFNEDYNKYASITISPKPDNLFRVCMLWSNITTNNQIHITDQKIESVKRNGFIVVEWGGIEIGNNLLLLN